MLRGELIPRPSPKPPPELQPLAGDLRQLLRDYHRPPERRRHRRTWTGDTLKTLLQKELAGDQVMVVSNREPYIHERTPRGIEVRRPASGLVTAVEPVMRACSGTWIAHGAGSADRETVDRHARVRVPPEHPELYACAGSGSRRKKSRAITTASPTRALATVPYRPRAPGVPFQRLGAVRKVNQRFADAVVDEAESDDPVVLVQDYHFALLPRMVREALPKATIITFWHIPWPNPESFGICPWREEILDGMLGSTILGFHTPFHRKNFLDTVDRYLETRIEQEASTISYGGQLTQVEQYPISIAWPEDDPEPSRGRMPRPIREMHGMPPDHLLGIGVDRLDYTKGIIERFRAVERLLELDPSLIGRFTFIQIAAPSRSSLDEYQNFEAQVRKLAERINQRFSAGNHAPILLKIEHHEQDQLTIYFRASEVAW